MTVYIYSCFDNCMNIKAGIEMNSGLLRVGKGQYTKVAPSVRDDPHLLRLSVRNKNTATPTNEALVEISIIGTLPSSTVRNPDSPPSRNR